MYVMSKLEIEGEPMLVAVIPTTRDQIHLFFWLAMRQRAQLVCETLGVTRSVVSEWRAGTRKLPARAVAVIAATLDIPEAAVNTPVEGDPLRIVPERDKPRRQRMAMTANTNPHVKGGAR